MLEIDLNNILDKNEIGKEIKNILFSLDGHSISKLLNTNKLSTHKQTTPITINTITLKLNDSEYIVVEEQFNGKLEFKVISECEELFTYKSSQDKSFYELIDKINFIKNDKYIKCLKIINGIEEYINK